MAAIFTTHLDLSFACVVNQSRSYALGASRALFFSSKNGSSGTISYGHFCHPHREKGQSFGNTSTCSRVQAISGFSSKKYLLCRGNCLNKGLLSPTSGYRVTRMACYCHNMRKNGVLLEHSADLGLKIWSPCR